MNTCCFSNHEILEKKIKEIALTSKIRMFKRTREVTEEILGLRVKDLDSRIQRDLLKLSLLAQKLYEPMFYKGALLSNSWVCHPW